MLLLMLLRACWMNQHAWTGMHEPAYMLLLQLQLLLMHAEESLMLYQIKVLKVRSGTFGSISDLNEGLDNDPGGENTVACPPPYKFKKSPYKQVLYGDSP
jgi:hypothetical protein